jgi:hypothetical protein
MMKLKSLLRALADGKGKLKITGFPKDHIVDIEKMDAESMGRAIKNHDCYHLYTEPEENNRTRGE